MTRRLGPPPVDPTVATISTAWMADAACHGKPTEVFFPSVAEGAEARGNHLRVEYARAKRICADCVVADDCLAYALATHQSDGVWGGVGPRVRKDMRVPRLRVCPVCGERFAHARRTYCSDACTAKRKRHLEAVAKVEQ